MVLFFSQPLLAWENHQSLMPWVLQGLPTEIQVKLDKPLSVPTGGHDAAFYSKLISALALNPRSDLPTFAELTTGKPITLRKILEGPSIDEPDHGMDEDLDDSPNNPPNNSPNNSYDPQSFRKWMGGTRGPTSKGFRHMFFGGWRSTRPLSTFQIPTGPIGLAPERARLLAKKGEELIRSGEIAWGFRVLTWAMHYFQDLAQPFHSVQILSLRMVPWSSLFAWPPGKAFEDLVRETTRTIANYHWAYEDYTYLRLTESENTVFAPCLRDFDKHHGYSTITDGNVDDPFRLAILVSEKSVEIGAALGPAAVEFFGPGLKVKGVDLPKNIGTPDYAGMAKRPDLKEKRENLEAITCKALANAVKASRLVLSWAFSGL